MSKFAIVTSEYGDWEGLYVDGKLVYENHSIPIDVIVRYCSIDMEFYEADGDWMESCGRLPKELKDVKETE